MTSYELSARAVEIAKEGHCRYCRQSATHCTHDIFAAAADIVNFVESEISAAYARGMADGSKAPLQTLAQLHKERDALLWEVRRKHYEHQDPKKDPANC
jgi:hypothetical protein